MTLRAAGLALLLAAFAPGEGEAAVAREGQVVMGTVLAVTVVAESDADAQRIAQAAIDEARRWDDALTIWRPEGELARFNRGAGRGAVELGPRLATGLSEMLRLCAATAGAFEPAVGRLPDRGDPSSKLGGIRHVLRIDGDRATLEAGSVLDPGGIGKGLALDAMANLVRKAGARSAFFDFGGSSQTAVGVPPGDPKGWSVLVAGFRAGESLGVLHLHDASLSTSEAGAVDTKPILDPRSGAPVPGPRIVSVLSADATSADAWSTALVVLGREGLPLAFGAGLHVMLEDAGGLEVGPSFRLEREKEEGAEK